MGKMYYINAEFLQEKKPQTSKTSISQMVVKKVEMRRAEMPDFSIWFFLS